MASSTGYCSGAALALLLAACGGGSPPVAGTFEPAAMEAALSTGDEIALGAALTLSAGNGSPAAVVLSGPAALLPMPRALTPGPDGRYALAVTVPEALPEGDHRGELIVRLCSDAACSAEQPGSPLRLPYAITVRRAPEWETHQGNAAHTGYVPLRLKAEHFHVAWAWTSTNATAGVTPFINPVATGRGLIAVTDDDWFSPQSLYVLNEADGALRWQHDFAADLPALNPPALHNGVVFAATSGHEATFMHAFAAADGQLLTKSPFNAQWAHYLAPTVAGGVVYTAGGFFGGLNAFNASDGVALWFTAGLPQIDMHTPALDARSAYVAASGSLHVIDRASGTISYTIVDPQAGLGSSHHGAPLLGSRGNVVTWSGDAFSGRASASTGPFEARALIGHDLASRSVTWRSAQHYITQPALAKGVIYAASRSPLRLAALDEATGRVLWSWTPNDGSSDFCRNVIVTDSHVFVSTSSAVHAVDLASRTSVWSYPSPGELALSADRTLLIGEGCRESTGRLIAVRLR